MKDLHFNDDNKRICWKTRKNIKFLNKKLALLKKDINNQNGFL